MEDQQKQKYSKGDFIGMLFHTRDYYNLYRYSISGVGTFSLNEAIREFCSELLLLTNELLEVIQGEEGFIDVIIPSTMMGTEGLVKATLLKEYIGYNRDLFDTQSEKAVIDKIEIILSKTIYKLKYLK